MIELLKDLLLISDPDTPEDVWQALGDKYCGDFKDREQVARVIRNKAAIAVRNS